MKKLSVRPFLACLALVVSLNALAQDHQGLHREKVSNHMSMLLPDDFFKLNEDQALELFGMAQLPMAIYCDTEKKVSLTCQLKKVAPGTEVDDKDRNYSLEKSFLKSSVASLYENIDFQKDTIIEVHGRQAIVFEFSATLVGEDAQGNKTSSETYNQIAYFLFKKKSYVINFACPQSKMDTWTSKANAIVTSIKVE